MLQDRRTSPPPSTAWWFSSTGSPDGPEQRSDGGGSMLAPMHPSDAPGLPRHVTLVALRYDYGKKERGFSYEYYNLYLSLKHIFPRVDLFDFHTLYQERGKRAMNEELLSFTRRHKPDWVVFALFQDEFIPKVIDEIRQY